MSEDTNRFAVAHTRPIRAVTDDHGNAVVIAAGDPEFRRWLCRPVVDNYGNEVMQNGCSNPQTDLT